VTLAERISQRHKNIKFVRDLRSRICANIGIEALLNLSENEFMMIGWSGHESNQLEKALKKLGSIKGHLSLARYQRLDVSNLDNEYPGFIAIVSITGKQRWGTIKRLRRFSQQPHRTFEMQDLDFIVRLNLKGDHHAKEKIYVSCLRRLDETSCHNAHYARVFHSGELKSSPRCSIVIPVYGSFVTAELLVSVLDSTLSSFFDEVIIVVDQPRSVEKANEWIAGLKQRSRSLMSIEITCIQPDRNGGFASAVNAGAEFARSEHLAILNSDVLPPSDGNDPIGALLLRLLPEVAILAPASLYPDGSVQHVGCEIVRREDLGGALLVIHPGKGMPMFTTPAVSLLSGAIVLCRKSQFQSIGGMPTRYGKGDFEDMEFSMRMSKFGELKLESSQKWFHLEGTSYDDQNGRTLGMTLLRSRLFENWFEGSEFVGQIHAE
jgi:GT2 family glycosyltransferase